MATRSTGPRIYPGPIIIMALLITTAVVLAGVLAARVLGRDDTPVATTPAPRPSTTLSAFANLPAAVEPPASVPLPPSPTATAAPMPDSTTLAPPAPGREVSNADADRAAAAAERAALAFAAVDSEESLEDRAERLSTVFTPRSPAIGYAEPLPETDVEGAERYAVSPSVAVVHSASGSARDLRVLLTLDLEVFVEEGATGRTALSEGAEYEVALSKTPAGQWRATNIGPA